MKSQSGMKNQVVSDFISYSQGIRGVAECATTLDELFAAHSAYACSFTASFKRMNGDYESEDLMSMLKEFNEVNDIFERNIMKRASELVEEALQMLLSSEDDEMYEGTEYEQKYS